MSPLAVFVWYLIKRCDHSFFRFIVAFFVVLAYTIIMSHSNCIRYACWLIVYFKYLAVCESYFTCESRSLQGLICLSQPVYLWSGNVHPLEGFTIGNFPITLWISIAPLVDDIFLDRSDVILSRAWSKYSLTHLLFSPLRNLNWPFLSLWPFTGKHILALIR